MSEAIDMSRFVEAKSDQLNADDLIGAPRTITIRAVQGCEGDQPIAIYYEGDNNKPFKPCKTIRRVLLGVWGPMASDYVGRAMTIYRDDSVTFGGLAVGGIRISHMSHIDKEVIVVVNKTKGKKAGLKILPLIADVKQHPADPARKWASAYIAKVRAAETPDALKAFENEKADKLAELKTARPELHAECVHALDGQREALAFETEPEGRDVADTGEGFGEFEGQGE